MTTWGMMLVLAAMGAGEPGVVARVEFSAAPGEGIESAEHVWRVGDRAQPLAGIRIPAETGAFTFTLPAASGDDLTLELREFRTAPGQSPAYVVELDGTAIAFRCREYDGDGPASAFIDLPARTSEAPATVRIVNRAPEPLHLSGAVLYRDLEALVRDRGLSVPMYLGATVQWNRTDVDSLRALRAELPDTESIRPMVVLATVPHARWSNEELRERVAALLAASVEADMPVELQVITWWAGTPYGPDGLGGRWIDPPYQQVTYDPALDEFNLTVPNRWSNVPWLTMRHPRLNAFKRDRFTTAARILRELWDQWAAERSEPFPVVSVVLDNEPTYWAAGMPNSTRTLQADFNPSMIDAAKEEGENLDPTDGLSEAEFAFLRRSLRTYNREMAGAFQHGIGACPLRWNVFSHTFEKGFGFNSVAEAFDVGVLDSVRFGGEWFFSEPEEMRHIDFVRELGVPAGINVEVGGQSVASTAVPFAYAAGCDRLSLFNANEALLRETRALLEAGLPEYPPVAWRPVVKTFTFEDDAWKDHFTSDEVSGEIIPGLPHRLLQGRRVEESNRTLLRLDARDTVGADRFTRLGLHGRARAFVFPDKDDGSYMAIRAGHSPDALEEAARLVNMQGLFDVDLTPYVAGAETAYVEFDMHPKGQSGWVGLMTLSVTVPWAEESLLRCNRDYGSERLRAENLLVGWRSEARWVLQQCATAGIPADRMEAVHDHMAELRYKDACEAARALLVEFAEDTFRPVPPSPDRTDAGILESLSRRAIQYYSYSTGLESPRLPLDNDVEVTVAINGVVSNDAPPLSGDHVEVTVEGGRAVRVAVSRGEATGPVVVATPATPYALPTLTVEGCESMPLDSRASVTDREGRTLGGVFPYKVDEELFRPGDRVRIRWNPSTRRIVEVAPAPE